MAFLIAVPVLSRPERVQPLLESLAEATTLPHRALFLASPGDRAEHLALKRARAEYAVMEWPAADGDFAMKINWAFEHGDEDVLVMAADDLRFRRGWDLAVAQVFETRDVGVVGTADLGNADVKAGRHSTHPAIARCYIDAHGGTVDGAGSVLAECYSHNFCDSELCAVAQARGCYFHCHDAVIEHLHPFWSKGEMDRTYQKGQRRFAEDRALFQRRRRLWAT